MERLFSVDEVAEKLGVFSGTVRRWCRDGEIEAYRIGRAYRIPESAVTAFLARMKRQLPIIPAEWRRRNATGV